jgi:hypothetical protein
MILANGLIAGIAAVRVKATIARAVMTRVAA